jgi:aminoglycoside phosphotransferase (APT) family kinase protein
MVGAGEAVRLLAEQVGTDAVVTREGSGWDHVAWRVVGADGTAWIVRAAREGGAAELAAGVEREVAVRRAARAVLGDLVPDAVVLDPGRGCTAHRRVPGVSLQDLVVAGDLAAADLARLGTEIGRIIAAVADLPVPAEVPDDDGGFAAWFADLPAAVAAVEHLLDADDHAAVARFLAAPPPPDASPDERRLAHNDLGAEHVLVDPGTATITGIIDWTDVARADVAAELGRLIRDLGAERVGAVLEGMGIAGPRRPALVERAWCYARCLVLEDLAYAVQRRPDLVAFERANLHRLFADV